MKTVKRMMMALVVMLMAVMVMPSTSAEAAKANAKLNKRVVYLVINDGENDKISQKTAKYTLKLTGVSKKKAKKAKWSSANKKIAIVNKKGIVTGKKHGSTMVTCKVGKKKYGCRVYVNDFQKIIKSGLDANSVACNKDNITRVHTSQNTFTRLAYEEGLISADEIDTSRNMADFGSMIKIHGYYYFLYYENCKWYKKYANIKEGRLFSDNPWEECNEDPEYKKQKEEEKARQKAAAEARAEKEKAEAEALAKAQAEDKARIEAEEKAKAEAEAKAKEELTKTIEAAGGEIKIVDGGIVMICWNNTEEERIEGIEAAGGKITYLNDGTDSYMITWDDTEDLGYKIICDNYGYRIIWGDSY